MNSEELYGLIESRSIYMNRWHSEILEKVLHELFDKGFVAPRAYILNYYKTTNIYDTTIIAMPDDALINDLNAESTYRFLKSIVMSIPNAIAGFMFVSEGTQITGDLKESFLLLTFENMLQGRKDVYRFRKVNEVTQQGKIKMIVKDAFHDRIASLKAKSVQIEMFNHVLRPNYFDKTLEIYN